MEVLRELAVAIVTGRDTTGELAPTPESEGSTGAREGRGPVNRHLPIRLAIPKRRRRRASDNRHHKEADDKEQERGPAKTSLHLDPSPVDRPRRLCAWLANPAPLRFMTPRHARCQTHPVKKLAPRSA